MNRYYEQIEDYINNELSHDERKAFEDAMNADPTLFAEVSKQQETIWSLQAAAMKTKVKSALKSEQKSSINLINYSILKYAAVGLILISFSVYYYFKNDKEAATQFAEQKIFVSDSTDTVNESNQIIDTLDPAPIVEESNQADIESIRDLSFVDTYASVPDNSLLRNIKPEISAEKSLFENYLVLLEHHEYKTLIKELVKDSNMSNENLKFILGHAYMKTGDFKRASEIYNSLLTSFQYKHDARWNLLLCNIHLSKSINNQIQSDLNRMIKETDFPFSEQAYDLNNRLNKN